METTTALEATMYRTALQHLTTDGLAMADPAEYTAAEVAAEQARVTALAEAAIARNDNLDALVARLRQLDVLAGYAA